MTDESIRTILLGGIVIGAICKVVGLTILMRTRRRRYPSEAMIQDVMRDMETWESAKSEP